MGQKLEPNSFNRCLLFQPIFGIIWKIIGLLLALITPPLAENTRNQKKGFLFVCFND